MRKGKALVILSGGQDSTTCLFWAKHVFDEVHAITFNYGQRHERETESARIVANMAGVASHEFVTLGRVLKSTSPLVSDNEVGHYPSVQDLPGGIEPTFVPCRNMLFLTLAANYAVYVGATRLVTGVCEEDYGGYPDCRLSFIKACEFAINNALEGAAYPLTIETPLMHLTKRQSVEMAEGIPGCMEALAYSHTCYDGQYPPNPHNHASLLRAKGFKEAGIADPLIVRAIKEGLLPEDYPVHGLVEE